MPNSQLSVGRLSELQINPAQMLRYLSWLCVLARFISPSAAPCAGAPSAPGRRVPAAELSSPGSRARAVGAPCAPHQGSMPQLGSISAVSSLLIASVRPALAMLCACTCTAAPWSLGFHLAKCPCSPKPGMAGTATQRQFFVFSLMWQDEYSAETK